MIRIYFATLLVALGFIASGAIPGVLVCLALDAAEGGRKLWAAGLAFLALLALPACLIGFIAMLTWIWPGGPDSSAPPWSAA